ncbi:hypothetical protein HETIRDRAFT_450288 [Heterobasidion irregulare TC 32-1]|uniref:Uncharacterized protein n=1 Tax=Heterobasidion irregulare (strain TC 32-1) TaxID=747525 RepID=W4K972_HETIT|nr:uncharacterized protein HETIRDRAFT_450288 [Heterobasidion irregulare TC 32-1]ETW82382.1 hypothetical protein HETIRDRAFT_450288 [Heterobasidion irregulare TC 32-1]
MAQTISSLSTTLLEDQELEARAKVAFLGFTKMRLDIYDGKTMIYNVYNNRPLASSTVSHLKQSMVKNGIRWWDEPIPVLVRHDWINIGQLKADCHLREALPLLERAPGAQAINEVHILGGQHRLAALQDYRADLQDKREKIRERLKGGVSEFDAQALRQKSDVVESKMEDILYLAVLGVDHSIARFLSRNSRFFNFAETADKHLSSHICRFYRKGVSPGNNLELETKRALSSLHGNSRAKSLIQNWQTMSFLMEFYVVPIFGGMFIGIVRTMFANLSNLVHSGKFLSEGQVMWIISLEDEPALSHKQQEELNALIEKGDWLLTQGEIMYELLTLEVMTGIDDALMSMHPR